jgi:hypothetical protein
MPLQSIPQGPFVKGLVASNQPLAEPKGAVTRASNFLLTARGALDVCDGSQILFAFNGAVSATRGKNMANFLFQPTGVANYYLSLFKALGIPLGPAKNLTASLVAGGTLTPGQIYYYVVTALDGANGETTASNEISITPGGGNLSVKLTWNVVPNAQSYNIYRGTAPGGEQLLLASAAQPGAGNATATITDTGFALSGITSSTFSMGVWPIGSTPGSTAFCDVVLMQAQNFPVGSKVTISGQSPAGWNGVYTVLQWYSTSVLILQTANPPVPGTTSNTTGTISTAAAPPLSDTTQQTALYKMPVIVGLNAALPLSYNDSNIVALYPADLPVFGGGGGGGTGGGGTGGGGSTGGGTGGTPASTPSGGVLGNVSLIPQFKQFTNRAIIALGNGYPPQIYSDASGTPTNPATVGAISAISVDAFGVVTVTTSTPHGLQAGGNVIIAGVANSVYNYVGPVITVISPTQFTVRNLGAIGAGASSGGTTTASSQPIINTFVPAYPVWTTATPLIVGDVIQPLTQPSPAIYLVVTQAGTTGAGEPTWPTGGLASVGQTVKDGTVVYTVAGLLNLAAPPPPGAGHIEVYAGALWVWNTSATNTTSGLDGPCALRMSSINNPNSWNPINQAFLDKDDGQEGMGLAKFTITAAGIPPEGSLVAFKNYVPYQIVGVFGSTNFLIQPVSSDMGCTAPRTIQFVPGFGIMRFTHLGIAVFNGVKDEIISEQIRPYLFPESDITYADITVVDANWISVAWSAQTANPPMYTFAAPIGASNGQLTRIFCYDLVFKAWIAVDLPFAVSTMSQFRTISANPITVFGGFNDGCLSRWQSSDTLWDTGASGARSPSKVQWSFRTLTVASQDTDQRVYNRRVVITGVNNSPGTISVSFRKNGVRQGTLSFATVANLDYDLDVAIGQTGKRFDATASGNCDTQIDGVTWETEARPQGVVVSI